MPLDSACRPSSRNSARSGCSNRSWISLRLEGTVAHITERFSGIGAVTRGQGAIALGAAARIPIIAAA